MGAADTCLVVRREQGSAWDVRAHFVSWKASRHAPWCWLVLLASRLATEPILWGHWVPCPCRAHADQDLQTMPLMICAEHLHPTCKQAASLSCTRAHLGWASNPGGALRCRERGSESHEGWMLWLRGGSCSCLTRMPGAGTAWALRVRWLVGGLGWRGWVRGVGAMWCRDHVRGAAFLHRWCHLYKRDQKVSSVSCYSEKVTAQVGSLFGRRWEHMFMLW